MTTNGGGALESNDNLRKEIPTSHDLVGSEVKVCPYIRLLGDKIQQLVIQVKSIIV